MLDVILGIFKCYVVSEARSASAIRYKRRKDSYSVEPTRQRASLYSKKSVKLTRPGEWAPYFENLVFISNCTGGRSR
jgi:hypothetical protein